MLPYTLLNRQNTMFGAKNRKWITNFPEKINNKQPIEEAHEKHKLS